jgi:hypothetical protein
MSARVTSDDGRAESWSLLVQSPADVDEFRGHLRACSSMDLLMITRDGDLWRGEACVAHLSEGGEAATMVTLSGVGPLLRA